MSAENLLALAERVEEADGPDRELDCRIWSALSDTTPFDIAARVVPDFGQWQAPHYTASLDAALTLVPEGLEWCAGSDGGAHVWKPGDYYAEVSEYGRARSAALALTAAALRARSAA